jgi:hypothetical protein
MKIRSGFVSNSSSSSFIILGIGVESLDEVQPAILAAAGVSEEELEEVFYGDIFSVVYESDAFRDNRLAIERDRGGYVVGYTIAMIGDGWGGVETTNTDIPDLVEKSRELAELLNVSPTDVMLCTGEGES